MRRTDKYVECVPQRGKPKIAKKPAGFLALLESRRADAEGVERRIFMIDETELNEKTEVVAVFRRDQLHLCQPLKFRFKRREVMITEIGLSFPMYKKGVLTHIFDVTDGAADYRLELDTKRLSWRVTREADHYE